MQSVARKILPAALTLAVISFFLPFVTYYYNGVSRSWSGTSGLEYGKNFVRRMFRLPLPHYTMISIPWVALAFLAALVGLGVSFMEGKKAALSSASLAGLSAILLVVDKLEIDASTMQWNPAFRPLVTLGTGYMLALTSLLTAVGISIYALKTGKGNPLPASQQGGDIQFCIQCGARNASADLFCKECGAKFT